MLRRDSNPPATERGMGTFGGHAGARQDFPALHILTAIRQGASAMHLPTTQVAGSCAHTLRGTVLGKLFTPIVPLFTKQQNW